MSPLCLSGGKALLLSDWGASAVPCESFWPFSLSNGKLLLSLHQEKPAKGHKIAVLLLICYPLSEQGGLFVCISVSCTFFNRLSPNTMPLYPSKSPRHWRERSTFTHCGTFKLAIFGGLNLSLTLQFLYVFILSHRLNHILSL